MSGFLATILTAGLVAASAADRPVVWEMDVDRPTLQVNHTADAVRGMKSDRTCRLGKRAYRDFGGTPRRNLCTLALEVGDVGYFAYCDAQTSYLLRVDLDACSLTELEMFRGKRLAGTAVIDKARGRIFFSHLEGTWGFDFTSPRPVAVFDQAAVYSKHEFFADAHNLYLLDTARGSPLVHRVDLNTLQRTIVRLGHVDIVDYRAGRVLMRSARDSSLFALYDVQKRQLLHRWRSPAGMRAYFVGDGWVAFWKGGVGTQPGEWVLVNAATGAGVYRGTWAGKRPPKVRWKGGRLYAGEKLLFVADQARPVNTPIRRVTREEPG